MFLNGAFRNEELERRAIGMCKELSSIGLIGEGPKIYFL